MFELLLLILFLICYGFYRLYRFTRRQAAREKTYWQDQKRFGKPIAYKIYTAVKVFLTTVIIAAVTYIFIALAYGGCPTLTDLTNHVSAPAEVLLLRRQPNLDRSNQPQISGKRTWSRHYPAPADSYIFLFVLQNKILK